MLGDRIYQLQSIYKNPVYQGSVVDASHHGEQSIVVELTCRQERWGFVYATRIVSAPYKVNYFRESSLVLLAQTWGTLRNYWK